MKKNKPIQNEAYRHHYIPQFIIRNFSDNEFGFVKYYDKKRKKILNMPTEDIFMYNDLYRDEINSPDDPVKIEKDFAKYEAEISKIIKDKFLKETDIILTLEEQDSLLLFLALMQFRSKNTLNAFGKNIKEETKEFLDKYQCDGNIVSLWKKNLGYIVACRSLQQVLDHPKIDEPFKAFMARDTFGLGGMYIIIAERRGNEDFFLSDSYPLVQFGEAGPGLSLPIMAFFPISPERMIITTYNGVQGARQEVRTFDRSFFARPYPTEDRKALKYHVRKIYEKDISSINDTMFKLAREGCVFIDEDRFLAKDRD